MTTGDRIRQLRLEHHMTQEELGAKVGVQKAAIYKYENGLVVNLKRSTIEKLAAALDTTPTYLMGMEEEPDLLSMLRKSEGRDQARISEIIRDFQQLNEDGKAAAVERVHELTEIHRYQNDYALAFEQYQAKHLQPEQDAPTTDEVKK